MSAAGLVSMFSAGSISRSFPLRRWGVLAILLVAVAVRLFGLTYHSLWFDEVMSTVWAARPAGEIWRVGVSLIQDKHPPLYYLALHAWTVLFGSGDVAVRTLGVIIGALAVLPAYRIGKALGNARAGMLGALLLALNPFLIWYSQEARMFMPATTLGLIGLYGTLRIADGEWRTHAPARCFSANASACAEVANRSRLLYAIGYVLLAICGFTAALYTYLFSAFLLPVAGAWVLLGWWLQRKQPGGGRRLGWSIGALTTVALLFLPLARSAWMVSGGESQPGGAFEGMGPALWRMLQVYTLGWPVWPQGMVTLAVVGAGGLAVLGLVVRLPKRSGDASLTICHSPFAGLFLAIWLAVPLLLGGVLLSRDRTVFAETRYFIFLAPALCLAGGRALTWLWAKQRAAALVFTALVFGITLAALPSIWSPQNRREAWREAAAFVQTHAGQNDAILIQADYVYPAFERYFRGIQPVFYPFGDRLRDSSRVEGPLSGLAGFETVWLVQSHYEERDPGNLVAGWFGARFPLVTEVFPAGIAIRAFVQHYREPAPALDTPGMAMASDQLRLLECRYQPGALPARDDVFHPPSNWIHVTTTWRTGGKSPGSDIYPRARLVDAWGQVWGESLNRPNDALHVWPTSRWLPGEVVRVDYDVNLNPVTPAGPYRIVVEVLDTAEQVMCGDVEVTR